MTNEAANAERQANQAVRAETMRAISASNEHRRQAAQQQFRANQQQLNQQQDALHTARQNNIAHSIFGVAKAAQNIGTAYDDYFQKQHEKDIQ